MRCREVKISALPLMPFKCSVIMPSHASQPIHASKADEKKSDLCNHSPFSFFPCGAMVKSK